MYYIAYVAGDLRNMHFLLFITAAIKSDINKQRLTDWLIPIFPINERDSVYKVARAPCVFALHNTADTFTSPFYLFVCLRADDATYLGRHIFFSDVVGFKAISQRKRKFANNKFECTYASELDLGFNR